MKTRALLLFLAGVVCAGLMAGCSTPSSHVHRLRLNMTPEEVLKAMGRPFTVRAAKTYEGGEVAEVWEYMPPLFSMALIMDRYDKNYWLFFENGQLVQWGEPGDYSGTDSVTGEMAIKDFTNKKIGR